MYVCVCNGVTERQIESAVVGGAQKMRDLRELLGVAAVCGRCAECAHQCLSRAKGAGGGAAGPTLQQQVEPWP